jgi:signal transduction histidine kinase
MGGELSLESADRGATFRATFPAANGALPPPP